MPKPLSLTQVASTLGIHRNTLAEWLKIGCPCVTRASRDKGIEWQLDTAAVHRWRVDFAVKEALVSYAGERGSVSKDEADRRRAVANAVLAEVEADERLRNVVLRHDAEIAMADFCQALRSGLSNAGNRIAGRASTMTNPTEIRELCETEINRSMEAAHQQLVEQWQYGADDHDAVSDPGDR